MDEDDGTTAEEPAPESVPPGRKRKRKLRLAYRLDDGALRMLDFETFGRSEEWKVNVLSNTGVRTETLRALTPGRHLLTVYALDPGVILDRIEVAFEGAPKYYGKPLLTVPQTQ